MDKDKSMYENKEFGRLFEDHINLIGRKKDVARHLSDNLPGSVSSFRTDLSKYCKGNLLGAQNHLTPTGRPLDLGIERLKHIMCKLGINSDSRMVEIFRHEVRKHTEVDTIYPPERKFPYGQHYLRQYLI